MLDPVIVREYSFVMRAILSLVLAAITIFGACWMYAKNNLLGRVSELSRSSNSLCNQRGTGPLDREAALARFKSMADSVGLEVSEAVLSVEPVGKGGQKSGMNSRIPGALAGMTSGKLSMQASVVKVKAHVHGEKWLWSVDKTITPSCMMVHKVEYQQSEQVRDAADHVRDRTRSIMERR